MVGENYLGAFLLFFLITGGAVILNELHTSKKPCPH
jgi:hypothetical protein